MPVQTTTTTANRDKAKGIFDYEGHRFRMRVEPDDSLGPPWKENDGHGIISDWTHRDKAPSERILVSDRGSHRYYNIAETMKLAEADGWGLSPQAETELAARLGHPPTKGEIRAAAVEADYDRMREWCEGGWYWVFVSVTLMKTDEDAPGGYFETKHYAALGGIESDSGDYLNEVARELAGEILVEIQSAKVETAPTSDNE